MSFPNIPATARHKNGHIWLLLILLLCLFAAIVHSSFLPGYGGGVDEASYFLTMKGLATQQDPAHYAPDPVTFVPEYMIETRPGIFYQKYPIGYPLLGALAYRIAGPDAPFLINPIFSILALLGTFVLARRFMDGGFALVATLVLAFNPMFIFYALSSMSHTTDLCFSLWAMFFAWSWHIQARWWNAALTGFLVGFAISIRYTEALLALPVTFLFVSHYFHFSGGHGGPSNPPGRRMVLCHYLLAFATATLALLPLFWFQYRAFGSPFISGYHFTQESSAFSVAGFIAHLMYALSALSSRSFGLFLLFPLAFVSLLYVVKKNRLLALFLALWIVPTLLLYISYYWVTTGPATDYVRFFLPIFPPVILASFLLLETISQRHRPSRLGIQATIGMLAFICFFSRPDTESLFDSNALNLLAANFARDQLSPDTALIADGYTSYLLTYKTSFTLYFPRYFDSNWVQDSLTKSTSLGPAYFNPLRAERFAQALGNRSQTELNAVLRESLLHEHQQGRPLALLTFSDDQTWAPRLAPNFTLDPIAEDPHGIKLYRLVPASTTPLR